MPCAGAASNSPSKSNEGSPPPTEKKSESVHATSTAADGDGARFEESKPTRSLPNIGVSVPTSWAQPTRSLSDGAASVPVVAKPPRSSSDGRFLELASASRSIIETATRRSSDCWRRVLLTTSDTSPRHVLGTCLSIVRWCWTATTLAFCTCLRVCSSSSGAFRTSAKTPARLAVASKMAPVTSAQHKSFACKRSSAAFGVGARNCRRSASEGKTLASFDSAPPRKTERPAAETVPRIASMAPSTPGRNVSTAPSNVGK
mmetsp:Transcript_18029/g.46766  ORF Transcript_18029/g.46766 Transcript_18029/m.46766 type:complete len:259 (-) Transcript_18029:55-831(-)